MRALVAVALCSPLLAPFLSAQTTMPSPAPTPPAGSASASTVADVPVRQVALFSSGVGYFQHEARVRGQAEAELRFKAAQINDVLKSLVLQDLDGGQIGAVTYPSQTPLEKTLSSFQVNLGDNPSLADLLNQVRGARVEVTVGPETIAGAILGVEQKTVATDRDGHPFEKPFLNLVTAVGLRSLPLDDARSLKLEDAGLQGELNKALAALAASRDQDKKPVTLHFGGAGERRVLVGYVVETPVWKASYRLIFPDESRSPRPDTAVLQGWAIVENQTDNDWNQVRLSLVSGRPISFVQDLYASFYVPRPEVKPELYSSLRPQRYEAGQAADAAPAPAPAPAMAMAAQSKGVAAKRARGAADPDFVMALPPPPGAGAGGGSSPDFAQSVAAAAESGQIGELFQYTVDGVTLPRQRSAMIPILNDPVPAEKVSVFNERTLPKHPLNGVRLKNDTADRKTLLQGPVTVLDGGSYAGDASLGDVPPGQSRLLTYGVDLELTVQTQDSPPEAAVVAGKIAGGVLEVTRRRVFRREYTAENKAARPKKLVLEYPRRGENWKLVDPTAPPGETLPNLYRFELSALPGQKTRFVVSEQTTEQERLELLGSRAGADQLAYYSRAAGLPDPVRQALTQGLAKQRAVADADQRIAQFEQEVEAITGEQGRIRENLKTVERNSPYATRLLKKLDDQETQIDQLRTQLEAAQQTRQQRLHELNEYLKGLNVG